MEKTRSILSVSALSCILMAQIIMPTSSSVAVSGTILMTAVTPDQNISQVTTVSLGTKDTPMDFVADIVGLGEGTDGAFLDLIGDQDKSPYSARAFMNVSPAKFHLDPGQSQNLLIQGIIPSDVGSGGRYAMVNIHNLPSDNQTVNIVTAFEVPIVLTVSSTGLVMKGEIISLNLSEPVSAKQQNLSLTFKNTGNYHYKALAMAKLKDTDGNILANTSTPLSSSSIIPTFSWLFKPSLKPVGALKPGSYYINTTVNLGDGTILATNEISFMIKS